MGTYILARAIEPHHPPNAPQQRYRAHPFLCRAILNRMQTITAIPTLDLPNHLGHDGAFRLSSNQSVQQGTVLSESGHEGGCTVHQVNQGHSQLQVVVNVEASFSGQHSGTAHVATVAPTSFTSEKLRQAGEVLADVAPAGAVPEPSHSKPGVQRQHALDVALHSLWKFLERILLAGEDQLPRDLTVRCPRGIVCQLLLAGGSR
mmetsp:Transcript_146275/g.407464  ORF Transcript_146275/g.407464 Transcript_146275/m.407464 type:complete len:204 (+) Transcript_146275:396-1007(+)